ncbi:uncharacterized protein [Spinacia oleracea]|uniref:Aspartic peptidase DDI1-type domain-containing protein n=1 Tax=Spinacia oleracea TaxID=3562 RepID=A0ABM3RIB3_SPIOL|nr:uncharacterized protein LOC130469862 [Spinacia oleracea]
MKDILTRKREFSEVETITFTEECSALLQNKSLPKLKYPGSFSFPCNIGNLFIEKALCDLGASVSVMPLSVCTKLNMGDLKVTNITLQMADRSVKYLFGVLEDVRVRVGKFFIPIDFVVLDMEEDKPIPIILGIPFLHTAGAVIDVKNGKLTLNVGDDKVTFNLTHIVKGSMIEDSCCSIDVSDDCINDNLPHATSRDYTEDALVLNGFAGGGYHNINSLVGSSTRARLGYIESQKVENFVNGGHHIHDHGHNFPRLVFHLHSSNGAIYWFER